MNIESILERILRIFGREVEHRVENGVLIITLAPRSVMRPRPLILQYDPTKNVALLVNAVTFERSSKPRQFARILRNLLELSIGGVLPFRIIEGKKSIGLEFQVSGNVEDYIERIIYAYGDIFSELMFISPQHTFYEYARYGARIGTRKVILIAKEYDDIVPYLPYESVFMVYPFLTIPDKDGKYFSSTIGIDYMYFPILSIASEEKNMFKIYEPVSRPPRGVELVPKDVREYISEILPHIRETPTGLRKILEILDEISKKPYIILEKIGELKGLIEEFKSKTPPPLPIYRTRQLVSIIERKVTTAPPIDKIISKLRDFVKVIDLVKDMDKHIREVSMYRMFIDIIREANFIISGRIVSEKIRKLQKFGAGNALYLSADEVREFLSGSNYVRITFIEDPDGRRKIVVEPISEQ